jgi:Kef-type K+ transport system membrane component KefB
MVDMPNELVVLGAFLLMALCAEAVGRHTRIPRISLLVFLGFGLGPAMLDVIDPRQSPSFNFVAILALSMVGFLVGGKLSARVFQISGGLILRISIIQAFATFCVVSLGLLALSFPFEMVLLLGAIATATDPAATLDAIKESGREDQFVDVLTGVVAIDDAWGLIMFSIALLIIQVLTVTAVDNGALLHIIGELFGAVFLGVALGLPMAILSGRIRRGQPTLMEAVGMVMLCAGIAQWLSLSHLLSCVVMGITVTNLARHHTRSFHAVEEIEWPFLAIFFIFSGAYLTLDTLGSVGVLLLSYVVLRLAGRVLGGLLVGRTGGASAAIYRWMGAAMLPQAGVAMAMTFQAVSLYPNLENTLLPMVIAATVLFELVGPIMTRVVLVRLPQNS